MHKNSLYSLLVCSLTFGVVILARYSYPKDIDTSSLDSVYYEPQSGMPFPLSSIENMLINDVSSKPMTKTTGLQSSGSGDHAPKEKTAILRRIGFRSNGCTCQQLTCGCCLGVNLQQFQFNREGCMNFTYSPHDFAVYMDMFMNNNLIFSNSFSAKNPPPFCLPVPIPYIPIDVEGCARIFDIYTPGQNLHMCFDFEMRVEKATVLVLHFDCMRMGNDGLALVKPGDMGGLPAPTPPTQIDTDIYDQVTEIKKSPI